MKLERLDLIAFGCFDGCTLDFSPNPAGLHIVYGDNEAGKSTALSAIEQFLYGIDPRTPFNFRHDYSRLRIGARLRDESGRQYVLIRRKGLQRTLLDADNQPVDEDAVMRSLGRIDRQQFTTQFALSHDELVAGGQQIAAGQGTLGETLFAAGSGIPQMRKVLTSLDEESDLLFRPRGQQQAINAAVAEYKQTLDTARQMSLHGRAWREAREALDHDQQKRTALQQRLAEIDARKHRLARYAHAIPLINAWQATQAGAADTAGVIILSEDFPLRRQRTEETLNRHTVAATATEEALTRLDAALSAIDVPHALLAEEPIIEELVGQLEPLKRVRREQPACATARDDARQTAEALLRKLRPGASLADAETLRLTSAQREHLLTLAQREATLRHAANQARAQARRAEEKSRQAQAAAAALPPAVDVTPLKQAVDAARAPGDLAGQLADLAAELSQCNETIAEHIARLPRWTGTPDQLALLPVPPTETIARFARDFEQKERQQTSITDRTARLQSERDQLVQEHETLLGTHDVPSEVDLQAARNLRNQGWQLIRRTWQGDTVSEDEIAAFLAHAGQTTDLADAYEQTIRTADELADVLRREAQLVEKLAALGRRRQQLTADLAELEEQAGLAERDCDALQAAWRDVWQPTGLDPLPPTEMRAWRAQYAELLTLIEDARKLRARHDALAARHDEARHTLRKALATVGPECVADTLHDLLVVSDRFLDDHAATAEQRHKRAQAVETATEQVSEAQQILQDAERALVDWQQEWTTALAPLNLPPDTQPSRLRIFLDDVTELFDHLATLAEQERTLAQLEAEESDLRRRMRDLIQRVAPDLADTDAELALPQLRDRLKQARIARQEHDNLLKRRQETRESLEQTYRERTIAEQNLHQLCQEAGVTDPAELPPAEQRSRDRATLQQRIRELEANIIQHAGNAALADFITAATQYDADTLPAQIADCERDHQTLTLETDALAISIAEQRVRLEAMTGGPEVARECEQAEQIRARLTNLVEDYVRLRLAAALLRHGIERYGAAHQQPVLRRAGDIFHTLTLGSFIGLTVDFGTGDELALYGRRRDDSEGATLVPMTGLSDGTCDQLYLALRLASLEQYLAQPDAPHVPLIVDDILIRFDDARSAATLRLLADFSTRTQVIFFTHHRHLVELAQRTIGHDARVHELAHGQ